ncbi:MAG: RNA polymerase sigma factor [Planctomycetes bacterium]|nr:RNA polymerase sigma factor [Planctomycetota bacterium]
MPPDDPRTDDELVAAINGGDPAAFDALYRRHRDAVARLALRFTGNHADALDVLQEAFAYLLGKFPGFHLSARLTTFLYPVVRHLALDLRRRAGRELSDADALAAAVAADPAPGAAPASRAELAAALVALPEPQREALLLRFVDGMSQEEVALALQIPVGTVKSRLHAAIDALRRDPRTRDFFAIR